MEYYFWRLKSIVNFCKEFKNVVLDLVFTDSKTNKALPKAYEYRYCWTPRYQEYWVVVRDIVDMCDMLGIEHLEANKRIMMYRVMLLGAPESIQERNLFETHIDFIKEVFEYVEEKIKEKLQLLEEGEMHRLNEALNCYIQGCNYAAVAMSVSAIEFRLLSLMQSVKPNPQLEKLTLGQLIDEYLQNKKAYKKIIPKKHEPLLNLCNTYRIFSVHPKREKITRPIATSIINMTFTFLLDEKLKQKAETK